MAVEHFWISPVIWDNTSFEMLLIVTLVPFPDCKGVYVGEEAGGLDLTRSCFCSTNHHMGLFYN